MPAGWTEDISTCRDEQEECKRQYERERRDAQIIQMMGVGHEPGDYAEESKRGRHGHCVHDLLPAFAVFYILREDGKTSEQESQNYDNN